MFDTVLIANRGEIARRIIRTCKDMGLRTVAVYSLADTHAAFVREADEAVLVGQAPASASYLVVERIIEAARATGAGAIHPGYGFLSEHAGFAEACAAAGIIFIGPTPAAIAAMGSKIAAKRLMHSHGVPVVPGHDGGDQSDEGLMLAAPTVGFPLLVKASAGGGGKGMRLVRHADELPAAIAGARREAQASFGDGSLLIERYIESPRHIEVQILGDAHGHVVHVFERECSIQRRHQKILEESPSPAIDPELRAAIGAAAVKAGLALGYQSAGTVEFVMGKDRAFYFLEVNTRLQVEHPVTEMVTGLDLVRLQIEIAMGRPLPFKQEDLKQSGHAIEARLYAEDPDGGFLPQTGTLRTLHLASGPGIRIDSGVVEGDEVGIHYDPMLAKIIAYGADRAEANRRLQRALERSLIVGVTTNLDFLGRVLAHPAWRAGDIHTHFIAEHESDLLGVATSPETVVTAVRIATVLADRAAAGGRAVLPGLAANWRNNPVADPVTRWTVGGQVISCASRPLGRGVFLTTIDGVAEDVEIIDDGADVHVGFSNRRFNARVVELGADTFAVRVGHATIILNRPDPFFRERDDAQTGSCKAPMPGRVVAVRASPGESVVAGQSLVVLEAMKMEHVIEAPRAGIIKEIMCQIDAVVAAGQELVSFES